MFQRGLSCFLPHGFLPGSVLCLPCSEHLCLSPVFSALRLGLTSGLKTRELMEHELKTLKMSARAPFKNCFSGVFVTGMETQAKGRWACVFLY